MYLTNSQGRTNFNQWDTGQILTLTGLDNCHEVHFCHRGDTCALVCSVGERDGLRVVEIPNVLLQSQEEIVAYLYCKDGEGNRTHYSQNLTVTARAKPEDYIYTETEVLSYTMLDQRLKELEEEGIAKTVADYMETHPVKAIQTVNGISPDEKGNVTIEPAPAIAVDITLKESDAAANAKAVGDALTYAGRNLVKTNDPVYSVGNAKANGKSVVLDYKKNTDTYFRIATTENLVEGEQYVLSFDCTGVPADTQGKKFQFMFGLSSEKSYVTLTNGRVVTPFKAGKYDNYGSVLFDDTASDSAGDRPTASMVGDGILLSNFSIEKGSFSAGYRHNEQEYDRLRIPVLTKTQKAEIQALLDKYHAAAKKTDASGKYTGPFYYDGETVQNDYANSRCWREYTYKDEKIHRFAMCCNTFCEAIWMGRDVSDFEGKTGDTYSNKITKAFDWGYMFNFNDRKTMAGVAERNDPENPKTVTLYYGYNNPNGYNSTNYEFSYSVNSVYDPAIMDSAVESGKFAKKQWFSSLMTQADIARELYKMGCEIPFEELDVGDLIFTKPRYTLNSDYDTFRNNMWWKNISHVAMVYNKAADGRLTFMDCTNTIYERPLFKFSESGFGVFYTARTMNLTNNIVMCARHPAAWGKSNMANIDRIDYMPMCYQTGYSTGQAIPFTAGMAVEEGLWYVYNNELGKAKTTGSAAVWNDTCFSIEYTNAQ